MEEARLKVIVAPLDDMALRGGGWQHSSPRAPRATSGLTGVQYYHIALGIRLARNTNHEGERHEKEG